ncbi:outer membrane lipid asymmetry maintenance protein MlaD [Limnobacter parvus]|uniref:Outer membrane lipid asymmetry maintenance protein MlaD n=1 Tax=Limnobacter parvus TaxID=2939690 RepID=A0ABT1XDB5_9BURK|nr:outer membrane lipid asymmetry maintenance protein MlaD [Limnobacter parvus]MCR2745139.1 outer membrane lipid asymmetry maintenance protein MlaD [Limnobacter parvus]
MKKNAVVDFWVGLFVLLGALALVFLALKAGNLSSFTTGDQYRVTAEFDNIGGLKPRAPVKSAGVTVGRVGNINLDPVTFRAVVALDLEEGFEFPKDSSARILTSGLLGEQYVGIEVGGDLENLAGGDKFGRTQSAVVLENLISQFLFSKASEGDSEK